MKTDDPTAPKPAPLSKEQSLVLGAINARIRGKKGYSDADAYEKQLQAICGVGKEVVLPDGRRFAVVDVLAGKTYASKMTYFDRYELRQIEA